MVLIVLMVTSVVMVINEKRFPMADDDGVDIVNGDVGVDGDQ